MLRFRRYIKNENRISLFNSANITNVTIVYVAISYLVFIFGPLTFTHRGNMWVLFYLVFYLIGLKCGQMVGERIDISSYKISLLYDYRHFKLLTIAGIFLGIVLSFADMNSVFSGNTIESIIRGLVNPAIGYADHLGMGRNVWLSRLRIYTGPLTILAVTTCVYKLKETSIIEKWLLLIYVITEASSTIMIGVNFGLFRVFILIAIPFLLSKEISLKRLKQKEALLLIAPLLVVLSFIVFYFFHSILSRMGWTSIQQSFLGVRIDRNHLLMRLPFLFSGPILFFSFYLSHGFEGFAIAQGVDFQTTFGFGAGRSLLSIPYMFGVDLFPRTYMYRIQDQWDPFVTWHTSFTWIANDIHFVGVIPYLFVISFLFTVIFREAKKGDFLAVSIIPFYVIMYLFLPLNNIVMIGRYLHVPFVALHLLWFVQRLMMIKRYNYCEW